VGKSGIGKFGIRMKLRFDEAAEKRRGGRAIETMIVI
jgi:hypothetical protein